MTTACSICRHPRRDEINLSLIQNGTRPTARTFGLSKAAVDRHKKHLPKQLATEPAAEIATDSSTLLARVEQLMRESELIAAAAKGAKNWVAATAALREARTCLELLAKVRGELQNGPQFRTTVAVAIQNNAPVNNLADPDLDVQIALQVQIATQNFDPGEIDRLRRLVQTTQVVSEHSSAQPNGMG
jgi:hypothetical protein